MFGLSITKILFTVGIIVVFWRGISFLERWRKRAEKTKRTESRKGSQERLGSSVDLVPCPGCGDYVPADAPCPRCRGGRA